MTSPNLFGRANGGGRRSPTHSGAWCPPPSLTSALRPTTHMTRVARKFWVWAIAQCCLVAVFAAWKFYTGVADYLAHPTDGDLYAHSWSFQAIVFLMFTLPKILVGLVAIFGLEWFIVRAISRRQMLYEKPVA
jgi:hypothetical protein